jgi:hypothetical protein
VHGLREERCWCSSDLAYRFFSLECAFGGKVRSSTRVLVCVYVCCIMHENQIHKICKGEGGGEQMLLRPCSSALSSSNMSVVMQ